MEFSRKTFLTGTSAAVAAASSPPAVLAAAPSDASGSVPQTMTFTTLRDAGADHLGIRAAQGIVDVGLAASALGIASYPRTVEDLVAGRGDVAALARIVSGAPVAALRKESDVEFGPLVSAPKKILCVGLNYKAHLAETGMKIPPFPDLFNKYNTAL